MNPRGRTKNKLEEHEPNRAALLTSANQHVKNALPDGPIFIVAAPLPSRVVRRNRSFPLGRLSLGHEHRAD